MAKIVITVDTKKNSFTATVDGEKIDASSASVYKYRYRDYDEGVDKDKVSVSISTYETSGEDSEISKYTTITASKKQAEQYGDNVEKTEAGLYKVEDKNYLARKIAERREAQR